ncbi:MAG: hypothetical protein WD894_02940, partial [Pirellulales bacterium]
MKVRHPMMRARILWPGWHECSRSLPLCRQVRQELVLSRRAVARILAAFRKATSVALAEPAAAARRPRRYRVPSRPALV